MPNQDLSIIFRGDSHTVYPNAYWTAATNSWKTIRNGNINIDLDYYDGPLYIRFDPLTDDYCAFEIGGRMNDISSGYNPINLAIYDSDPFNSEPLFTVPYGIYYDDLPNRNYARFGIIVEQGKTIYLKIWEPIRTSEVHLESLYMVYYDVLTSCSIERDSYQDRIAFFCIKNALKDEEEEYFRLNYYASTGDKFGTDNGRDYFNYTFTFDPIQVFKYVRGSSARITIEATDSDGNTTTAYANITLTEASINEISPKITSMVLEDVPDSRMPSGYNYVVGYSKVKITTVSRWGLAEWDTETLRYSGENISFNPTNDLVYTTEKTLTGATTFTLTLTDKMGRSTTQSVTLSQSDVTHLTPLSATLSKTVLTTGDAITVTPENFIGEYDYAFTGNNKQLVSKTDQTAASFTETSANTWFETAGISTSSMNVIITITDRLERSITRTITVRMPGLSLTISDATREVGQDLTIQIEGRADREATLTFSVVKNDSTIILDSRSMTTDSVTITALQSWFTNHSELDNDKQINVTVTVSATGSSSATGSFILSYPALDFTMTGLSNNSITAGGTLQVTIENRASERITIELKYNSTLLKSQTASSNSASVVTNKAFFDTAKVTTEMQMQVSISISDKRNRTASKLFVLKASDAMKPTLGQISRSIVQPSPASQSYPSTYIANVSKVTISVEVQPTTNARIINVSLQYDGVTVAMQEGATPGIYSGTTVNAIRGNTDFTIIVTDERGFTVQGYHTLTNVYDYSAPSITVQSYHRCNQDGSASDTGAYCQIIVGYSVSPIDNNNAKTAKLSSTVFNDTKTLTSYTETVTYFFAVNIEHSYDIAIMLEDSIQFVTKTIRISTAGVIMDFLAGGKGIGLGKVAEHPQMVEVNSDWEFKACVKVNGELVDLGTILATILGRLEEA